mmetsp:Transcript_4906/g.7270  ORF Transcript_4906/g.7270 Transcript_4906/m.7270 type:complete len:516 (+) Transcript_4906:3-1550(+)
MKNCKNRIFTYLTLLLIVILCVIQWKHVGVLAEEEENEGGIYIFLKKQAWYYYLIYGAASTFVVLFAGLMSGLTLGVLSLDVMQLEVLERSGTKSESKYAKRIKPLVKRHHLLLVTLLLCNAAAMEALPIFLDNIVHEVLAIVISVSFVLIFGEILPQAVCSRWGLAIGAILSPLLWFLIIVLSPIAWPIAKLLDCILGHSHHSFFRRAQLKEFVKLHGSETGGPLNLDEIAVIRGALNMQDKTCGEIMTSIDNVFMLEESTRLTKPVLQKILNQGHSRIPVFRDIRSNVIGLLLVKSLILIDPDDGVPIKSLELRPILRIAKTQGIWDQTDVFQKTCSHLALIVDTEYDEDGEEIGDDDLEENEEVTVIENIDDLMKDSPINEEKKKKKKKKKASERDPLLDSEVNEIMISRRHSTAEVAAVARRESLARKNFEEHPQASGKIVGLLTLEDIIEELLGEEIVDETDVYVDVETQLRVADMYRRISVNKTMLKRRFSMDPSAVPLSRRASLGHRI